jgi:hypothetical protein
MMQFCYYSAKVLQTETLANATIKRRLYGIGKADI